MYRPLYSLGLPTALTSLQHWLLYSIDLLTALTSLKPWTFLIQTLSEHGPSADVSTWPVIGQFSSIGKLGASASNWLRGEWLSSTSELRGGQRGAQLPDVKLVSNRELSPSMWYSWNVCHSSLPAWTMSNKPLELFALFLAHDMFNRSPLAHQYSVDCAERKCLGWFHFRAEILKFYAALTSLLSQIILLFSKS